jgi:hypothetical protein
VPDIKDLKLAVLSPEHARQSSVTGAFVEEMLKKCGTPFRTYQNTLLVLVPDSGEFATLRQQVKRLLALRAIRDDKTLMRQLSEENKKTLESKLKDIESGIPFRILSAYRHFAKAGESSLEWFDLGLPTVGEKGSLAKRVREYLKGQELLLDKIPPQRLLQKTLRDDEQERPLVEIVDAFRKYPQLPMLESEAVVLTAVAHGVREGTFGVKVGERIYFNEALTESVLDYSAVLVRKEVAEQAKQARESASPSPSPEPSSVTQPNVQEQPTGALTTSSTPSQEVGVRGLRLRVKVPWDKLSDFVRGVVMPLRSDGADMEVEVLIQARSGSGSMKPSTLEQKVQETLNQIGAKVLEDTRE